MKHLRVIDVGQVSALRSQSLWHGIAEAMTPETGPTLSICRPGESYVGLGYHRSLDEIDLSTCARQGLRIIRRRIGGGPVFIDPDQLFFQITLPAAQAPRRIDRLYEELLRPAVSAFRTLGLNAQIRGLNDISIEDRRLSGTGAGRMKDGVTVVGNVIFKFPHQRMTEILALPTQSMRNECLRLMKSHVTSLEAEGLEQLTSDDARAALIDSYARDLNLAADLAELTPGELEAIALWEERFEAPDWLRGPRTEPRERLGRQIKISADVWVYSATREELELQVSFCAGRLERLSVSSPNLNGTGKEIGRRLSGCPVSDLESRLAEFGNSGERIFELLRSGAVLR